MPYYKETKSGIIFEDHRVLIGDVNKNTLLPGLADKIADRAKPVYIDHSNLKENLFDMDGLEAIQPLLHGNELTQLNEIFGFINSRGLAYVRFV